MNEPLKLCLDLNIWCAALLSELKGKQGKESQTLIKYIQQGSYDFRSIQLIISYGMLNRLKSVLKNQLKIPDSVCDSYIKVIESYTSPQIILGGVGVIPLKDEEDRQVLETALAGKATLLITRNFKDFITYNDTYIIKNKEHAIHIGNSHKLHIVYPPLALHWIKANNIPTIDSFF